MASRSLGTLTIDLVAKIGGFVEGMDRAARQAAQKSNTIKKDLIALKDPIMKMGKWFTASAAVAAAGLAVMAVRSGDMAREIKAQAQAANTSAAALQAQGFAVNTVGIQMDQYADILKDVNDRFGEFLATGSGPMTDFFQNVAPKIGLTAEAFRDLSGPDALQLFVTSMEKAGLSQQQMTFYMEALSSNSTRLLPLLRENGKTMKALTKDAHNLGVVVSDVQIGNLVTMANKFNQAKQAFEATQLEFIANLGAADLSSAVDAMNGLRDVVTDPDFAEGIVSLVEGMANAAGWAAKLATWFGKFTQDFRHSILRGQGLTTMGQDLADSIKTMEGLINGSALMGPDGLRVDIELPTGEMLKAGATVGDLTKRLEELRAISKRWADNPVVLPTVTVDPPTAPPRPGAPSQNAAALAEYQAMLKAIQTDEEKANEAIKARVAILNKANLEAGAYENILLKILNKSGKAAPDFSGLAPEIAGPQGELDKIDAAQKKLEDWRKTQREITLKAQEETVGDHQAFRDRLAEIDQEYTDKSKYLSAARAIAERKNTEDILNASSSLFGGLADIAAASGDRQSSTYRTLFALSKGFAIAEAALHLQSALLQSFSDESTPTLAGKLANYATVASAAGALVSNIASISYSGMAHDGIDYIPKEGTWLLDRGERVVDKRTNQDLKQFLGQQYGGSTRGGDVNVKVYVNRDGSVRTESPNEYTPMGREIGEVVRRHTQQTIAQELRPGGMLYRAGTRRS